MSYEDYFKSEQWTAYLKLMEERPAAFQDSEQIRIMFHDLDDDTLELVKELSEEVDSLYACTVTSDNEIRDMLKLIISNEERIFSPFIFVSIGVFF